MVKNNYINYVDLNNDEYIAITNNYIENYHRLINYFLECYHPKISYLISKYKDFLINVYQKIKNSLVNKIESKTESFIVVKDILNFFKHLKQKYNEKINLNYILQGDEETKEIINKTCNYLIEMLFDIDDNNYENELDKDENSLNSIISNDEMENDENNDNLDFEEFHPEIRNKSKKKLYSKFLGR